MRMKLKRKNIITCAIWIRVDVKQIFRKFYDSQSFTIFKQLHVMVMDSNPAPYTLRLIKKKYVKAKIRNKINLL